jgi:F420-non-reducing hydrogenase iron-sulfur subunit
MNDLSAKVKSLGPLGSSEGIPVAELVSRMRTAEDLVPYIKLVERERLRVPVRTEEGYRQFFGSQAFDDLFDELVLDKLVLSRIMGLLRKKPVAAMEIPGSLDLEPSEVARHLQHLTERGLVKFDAGQTLVAAV